MAWNDESDKETFNQANPDIMEQQPKVEFGYFENRKEKFKTELQKGFANGFGSDNMTTAEKKKPAKKKPAAKTSNADATSTPKPKKTASGDVQLPPPGTPREKWSNEQVEAWKAKMAAARAAKKK